MKTKFLIYCTKGEPIYAFEGDDYKKDPLKSFRFICNGKIVAEFECDKVEEIKKDIPSNMYMSKALDLIDNSCLTIAEYENYVGDKKGYAIHISNLKTFDKPLELNELRKCCVPNRKKCEKCKMFDYLMCDTIRNAPQNMCKVYRLNANGEDYDEYILISIRPEWVLKILNGEKTIEVRKQILNELKEMI